MLRRLHFLLLLVCIATGASANEYHSGKSQIAYIPVSSSNFFKATATIPQKQSLFLNKMAVDTALHLIYEDAKTKVYYSETDCDNSPVLKLKIVNLSDAASVISYKLWADAAPKTVSLFAGQELEGICAVEYKTVLLETIPAGLTINDIKVTVTY